MENENKTISRNQQHSKAMTCIYQYLFYLKANYKQDIKELINSAFKEGEAVDPFVKKAVIEAIKHMPEIVETIDPLLNKWTFKRLGLVEQAILSLGYVEIKYLDVPRQVATDVCVKLAIKFADAKSYKFINAVLEKI